MPKLPYLPRLPRFPLQSAEIPLTTCSASAHTHTRSHTGVQPAAAVVKTRSVYCAHMHTYVPNGTSARISVVRESGEAVAAEKLWTRWNKKLFSNNNI